MATRSLPKMMLAWLLAGVGTLSLLVATPAATRAEDEKDRQIQELRERLERLEKELGLRKEVTPAPAAATAPGAPAAPVEAPQSIGDRIRGLEEAVKMTPFLRDGKIHFDETRWISLGGGLRTSANFIENAAPNGDFSKDFKVDDARLYVNAQLFEGIQIELNTEISSDDGRFRILDAIGKFDFTNWFKVWGGRLLPPSDRANLDGPFYQLLWDFPFVSAFPAIFAGRDNGAAVWGELFNTHFKYQLGVFQGQGSKPGGPNVSDDKLFAARLVYNFLDPEPGYYNSSTYFGAKKVLALGVTVQHQGDVAGTATARKDFTGEEVDLLFEYPLDAGVVTLEGAFYNYDYGNSPVALRPDGTLEGRAFYVQTGFLFPQKIGIGQVQPAFRVQHFDSEVTGSNDPADHAQTHFDIGLNYIIKGHNAKIMLIYTRVQARAQTEPKDQDHNEFKVGLQLQF